MTMAASELRLLAARQHYGRPKGVLDACHVPAGNELEHGRFMLQAAVADKALQGYAQARSGPDCVVEHIEHAGLD
jgi:hypothetical protein